MNDQEEHNQGWYDEPLRASPPASDRKRTYATGRLPGNAAAHHAAPNFTHTPPYKFTRKGTGGVLVIQGRVKSKMQMGMTPPMSASKECGCKSYGRDAGHRLQGLAMVQSPFMSFRMSSRLTLPLVRPSATISLVSIHQRASSVLESSNSRTHCAW